MAAVISMPRTDPGLLAFSLNFSTKISATPTAYNLTSALASAYATVHANFASALAACDPTIRSKPATVAKNQAREILKNQLLLLALQVQAGPNVTDAQKTELGLTVAAQRQNVPIPTVKPAVDIVKVDGHTVTIRIHDAAGDGKRPKPAGVKGAAYFSAVAEAAPTDPTKYKWEGNSNQSINKITFPDAVTPGSTVWFTAAWLNEKQEAGPGCDPISAIIQFGGMSMTG